MKRAVLFIAILISVMSVKAQFAAPYNTLSGYKSMNQPTDTGGLQKKWSFSRYSAVNAGFIAFKGGGASFLSVPLGLQVSRQLHNNVYAFGGVSLTPSLIQGSGPAFYQPGFDKTYNPMQPNRNFSINPAAQIGVMYISNDKTFSVSGSINVSRSTYNGYSPLYAPTAF
ncbi:hypothetical protein [Chitinophaga sp. MD30]|uniref:hypothetical protein n=1 Tax=Chitinophaga sp. MD30 TaxID=2033437 RepID=UPI0012FD0E6C|nr:hypothetical protein [Chitinophaga sp. MD30]